ncbi:TVP38/TMEM64 family protein [Exiguobacterium flavidum]|uniref:TVP38/TMEM64 family protein n=1 Tax=Exiguobacterium flavidum TaxID=2184695 RepID=UPI000DF7A977|nr:TVP38/TMEM64 family protein [Exiguobacterium flavidum]
MKELKIRDWLPFTVYLSLGGLILLYLRLSGRLETIDIPALSDWIASQGIPGMFLYVLVYAIRPLFFFPASLLTLFGGYTYGPWLGMLLDVVGAGTGGLLSFWIARLLGRRGVEKLTGNGRMNDWDERIGQNGFLLVLLVRLIPFIPFDAISYASGLSKIRFRQFAVANYLGIIPGAFVYNNIGANLRDPYSWRFAVAILLYVLFFIAGFFVQRRVRKKQNSDHL